jgi:TonB family protein
MIMKPSVILATAFLLTFVMRKRAAAERHLLWTVAIISAALVPKFSSILPVWQPSFAARIVASLPRLTMTTTEVRDGGGPAVIFHAQSIETTQSVFEQAWPYVWIAGCAVCLFLAARGIIRQNRIGSRSHDALNGAARSILMRVAEQLRCKRAIRLRLSANNYMPCTWGIVRPNLLLPASSERWPDERLRVVIAHEMAHVQRMDWLFQVLAQIACAAYWFNPLFWIAANQLHRESERACDDSVIRLGVDAREYATHLVEIARSFCQSNAAWSPVLAMARHSALEKRFMALLKPLPNRSAVSLNKAVLILVAALTVVIPIAAMQVSSIPGRPLPIVDQYTTPPLYSDEARSQAIEGKVTVEVTVTPDGKARALQVVRGLGHGLDQNALVAVRDWHFVPATLNGRPIEVTTQVDVEFSLKNAELNELIANDMATRIGPGVTPPQVVHRADPVYPSDMTSAKPEGSVVLDAVIPENGIPHVIRVIRSLDWQFDEIAINALKEWRFSPAIKDGEPVKVRMNVAVEFTPHS